MDTAFRQAATLIDPKLLSRVAKGEREAFVQLYDESSVLLFTLAHRVLGDRDEAAQLLYEVYLEVWKRVARYDVSRGTPIAWLVALTRTRATERLRTRLLREPHASGHSGSPGLYTQSASSLESCETMTAEWRDAIVRAIADLPSAQRDAIDKAYYQGLSYTEIAAKLDQPLGTIKTRLKLAMSKLRAALQTAMSSTSS